MSDATPERWLPVPGYEGLYEVSDLGNVRSLHKSFKPRLRGDLLSPALTAGVSPRLGVCLYKDGASKTRLIHQLVLEAFVGPRPSPDHEACHGPGGALDNRLMNLSWGTRSKNQGLDRVRDGTSNRGTRQWQAKLTEDIVMECRKRYTAGETQYALAAEFGITQGAMSEVITGRQWAWLPGAVPIDRTRHGKSGTAHHAAKLTWDDVAEIRRRAAAGEQQRPLAREFGISQPVVSKIVRRETWR